MALSWFARVGIPFWFATLGKPFWFARFVVPFPFATAGAKGAAASVPD
jgi:hypothetical protein